jgi:hypothetical protein
VQVKIAMLQSNWSHNDFQYTQELIQNGIGSNQFFKAIESELPPVFTRRTASQAVGGLISAKTMANLDALQQGPSVRVNIGSRRVGYERDSFIQWLKARIRAW